VRLPIPVDPARVNATFRNGVLVVTMTKIPEAKGISIPIKLG
jgi:HSP20 family molecular chaperone IbpA